MSRSSAYYASQLRQELCARNRVFASKYKRKYVESYGSMPVIVYEPVDEERRHGNFLDETYAAILNNPEWRRRLVKVHAQAMRSLPRCERGWRELDSCMSSDALLMNIFCYPGVLESSGLRALLGIDIDETPEFGFKARVPLSSGLADRTEVDMRIGSLLIEAKLTEGDFQTKGVEAVQRYRDFEEVFEAKRLPRAVARESDGSLSRRSKNFVSYQLIRNVLSAEANECRFCVMLDARRPDLIESWYAIMSCVRPGKLRRRCQVLTWQELSAELPNSLRAFLDDKYGIVPPGTTAVPPPQPVD